MKFNVRSLLIRVTLVAFIVGAAMSIRANLVGVYAEGVSADSANSKVWQRLHIPDTGTDVTFAVDFWKCEIDFAISETEFIKWCGENDWETEWLEGVDWYLKPALEHPVCGKGKLVGQGYYFRFPNGDGIFDAGRSRVNCRADRFP